MNRHQLAKALAATALLLITTVGLNAPIAEASSYTFTTGAYNGARSAAGTVVGESTCAGLTQNKLTAIMLSIPVHEIGGGSHTVAQSPMTLSRWDTWSLNSTNPTLYSHTEYPSYKRAHWNPGVGLWQLDTWGNTTALNHGERANARTGGLPVGRYLRDGFCAGTTTLKSRLNSTWFACRTDVCYNTYVAMYNATNDSLRVTLATGSQYDGGVENRSCRWGTSSTAFTCYFYNIDLREGAMDVSDPSGDGARSPIAFPFLSLTDNSIKRAVFLRSRTGYSKEIIKAVRTTEDARNSSLYTKGWYDDTTLQVQNCNPTCVWSDWGP